MVSVPSFAVSLTTISEETETLRSERFTLALSEILKIVRASVVALDNVLVAVSFPRLRGPVIVFFPLTRSGSSEATSEGLNEIPPP